MKYTELYLSELNKIINSHQDFCELKNASILITGASGLIGSTIADLLLSISKKNNLIIYLAGRSKDKIIKRYHIFKNEIDYFYVYYDSTKQIDFTNHIDYIIHCASNSDPLKIIEEPVNTIISNVNSLYDLLNCFIKNNGKSFLFISSSEIYGLKKNNLPYEENDYGFIDILNPRACYPTAKRCGENLCISFAKQNNINIKIVRPGHIYGPQMLLTDSRASAQFIYKAINNENIILKSNGEQLRSYCFSLDCASAIITVLIKGKNCTAYNISNKNSICTIKEFAECVAKQSHVNIDYLVPTDKENKSYNLMTNSSLNSDLLESLGWKPCFNLTEGIKSTLENLKND